MTSRKISDFSKRILKWYDLHQVYYPWRTSTDPYQILLCEIMLRKTTRRQVAKIFDKFFQRYASFKSIAEADENEIKQLIRPLGIENSRTKIIKRLANSVLLQWNGMLPLNQADLLSLPGVGIYSANAVLCLTKGERVPLVDTNAIRVIQRVFCFRSDSKRIRTDPKLWSFATSLIPSERSKDFNLAILDFAAEVCTIKSPKCSICPVRLMCKYYMQQSTNPNRKYG
jgi:A/G-specific adenine glycosylase